MKKFVGVGVSEGNVNAQFGIAFKLDRFEPKRSLKNLVYRSMFALLVLVLMAAAAMAAPLSSTTLPEVEKVQAGVAEITKEGNTMVITLKSQRAVIKWKNFHIGPSATVRIVQPNEDSALLIRTGSPDKVRIFGRLVANGNIFFVSSEDKPPATLTTSLPPSLDQLSPIQVHGSAGLTDSGVSFARLQ